MTQANLKQELPADAQFGAPVWPGCVLVYCEDSTGLVKEWYLVETGRWLADDCVRKVGCAYAESLLGSYSEPPSGHLPLTLATSGEIEC